MLLAQSQETLRSGGAGVIIKINYQEFPLV